MLSSVLIRFFTLCLTLGLLLNTFALSHPTPTFAAGQCSVFQTDPAQPWYTNINKSDVNLIKIGGGLLSSKGYYIYFGNTYVDKINADSSGVINITNVSSISRIPSSLTDLGTHTFYVKTSNDSTSDAVFCSATYEVQSFAQLHCEINVVDQSITYGPGDSIPVNGKFWIEEVNGTTKPFNGTTAKELGSNWDNKIDIRLLYKNSLEEKYLRNSQTNINGNFSSTLIVPAVGIADQGWWGVVASKNQPNDSERELCSSWAKIDQTGTPGENPCKDFNGDGEIECKTAIGNIPTSPKAFVTRILQIATGIGGGIALILMVIGSIRVLTSAGDQQKLAGGRDMIVAAVSGLLFIIFSVVILRFIGISILGGVI